jgi:hypothetical protein
MNTKQTRPIGSETSLLLKEFDRRFSTIEKLLSRSAGSPLIPSVPDTLQPSQVCKKLGWSRSKFEQFKRAGLFRTTKIGGKIYVSTADLRALFPEDFF